MADTVRAFALARQTAQGTLAGTPVWLNFMTDFEYDPKIMKEIPLYKTNTRMQERRTIVKTRDDTVTLKGDVDSTEFGILLCSALSIPTGPTSNVFTWLAGATGTPYLSCYWMEGLTNLWWTMKDARVNKLEWGIDVTSGKWTYDAEIRGLQSGPSTSPPTPAYTPAPDDSPFQTWQTVISYNSIARCVRSCKFTITNNFNPLYCTPATAPTSTTEAGLAPSRYTEGRVEGRFDVTIDYTADAASLYYDYRHNLYTGLTVSATMPENTAALTYTPTMLVNAPNVSGLTGKLDRNTGDNVYEVISGAMLWSSGISSILQLQLTNGASAYAGS